MDTKTRTRVVTKPEAFRIEHELFIDGVIEIPANVDAKEFFDGLMDKIIEYVEAHGAVAGLGMSHKEYHDKDADDEAVNGKGTT